MKFNPMLAVTAKERNLRITRGISNFPDLEDNTEGMAATKKKSSRLLGFRERRKNKNSQIVFVTRAHGSCSPEHEKRS